MFLANLLGKLSIHQIPTDLLTAGAGYSVILGGLVAAGLLFYFKKWKWLWREWLTSLDPKRIGIMYISLAILMLLRGGVDALLMRTQQATSVGASHGILSANHFQQIFSAHGTLMIFFVAMGLMFGLINIIVPLQIGARDVAFPFLNAASFWLYAAGALLINAPLIIGEFSAAGWLAYPPLSELYYSPGVGVDYWIWSLQIAGVGSLLSGVNFLVTIFKLRAPGMRMMLMPLFSWSVLGSMILVIFAFPILTATLTMLALDRSLGMHFFTAGSGGNAMMYVNLIWAWGHPEVYILILPAFGIFSEIVATFSRKRLFGYTSMVWALMAITFLSFSVWLHHFFTMGAGPNVNAFFGVMTMIISIPTGVKVFNWLFTMYRGRIKLSVPMLWFLGFIVTFTIGGAAGVLMAVPAADFQLHNSLFLVAHFHTMIIGGVVFGYFAGLTYWFPKIFGFKLNELIGKWTFWSWLVGFVLAFVPLYILGIMGATRRMDHYEASLGWQGLFIVAGIGVLIIMIGTALLVLQVIVSYVQRKNNLDTTGDPWNGRTLEWSTTSPAPFYNFAVLPQANKRDAFWAMKHRVKSDDKPVYEAFMVPKNSHWPIFIAGGAFFFGFSIVWHIWWLAILALLSVIAFVIIRTTEDDTEYEISAAQIEKLDTRAKESYA